MLTACIHKPIYKCDECKELQALRNVEQALRNALPYHQDGSEGIRRYKLVEDALKILDTVRLAQKSNINKLGK